jgi:hypothetical protein
VSRRRANAHLPYRKRKDRADRCHCGRIHKRVSPENCRRKKKQWSNGPREKHVNAQGQKLYAPYGYLTTIAKFGRLLTWNEMSWKERRPTALRIRGGHNRNRYWRERGYPNLVNARAALKKKQEARLRAGQITPERKARLRRVAAGEIAGSIRDRDAENARIFIEGEREIQRAALPGSSRPLIGGILVAGSYDPKYLERREMRLLDIMGRMPG